MVCKLEPFNPFFIIILGFVRIVNQNRSDFDGFADRFRTRPYYKIEIHLTSQVRWMRFQSLKDNYILKSALAKVAKVSRKPIRLIFNQSDST